MGCFSSGVVIVVVGSCWGGVWDSDSANVILVGYSGGGRDVGVKGVIFLVLFFVLGVVPEAYSEYPLIQSASRLKDPLFRQQQQDVDQWYATSQEEKPKLMIYRYRSKPGDTLFTVSAAFGLPYETIATLNRWDSPLFFDAESEILIPNQPGLFVPRNPEGGWEELLFDSRSVEQAQVIQIKGEDQSYHALLFFSGDRLASEERSQFLTTLFISPLKRTSVTSPYGYRPHPITGVRSFHQGVDLKAFTNTSVHASSEGTVVDVGRHPYFGLYLIVKHKGGFETLYAHLGSVSVSVGQHVEQDGIIARTGSSGMSTGPHLHFEIRRNGQSLDPELYTLF